MKIKHIAVAVALAATLAACADEGADGRTTSSVMLAIDGAAVDVLVTHASERPPSAEALADTLAVWAAARGGVLGEDLLVDLREELPPHISAVSVAGPMGTCGEDEGGLTCILAPGVAER